MPESLERQVRRAQAEARAQHPNWRRAAIQGAVFGVFVGVLQFLAPVLPLGATEPLPVMSFERVIRTIIGSVLAGIALYTAGAFLFRLARRAIVAVRFRAPVA